MHPFIKKPVQIPKSVSNRVFDLSTEREINDILFITDVLVTDYSSVIFENAVIGNACVLYAPDLEQYTDGKGFILIIPIIRAEALFTLFLSCRRLFWQQNPARRSANLRSALFRFATVIQAHDLLKLY